MMPQLHCKRQRKPGKPAARTSLVVCDTVEVDANSVGEAIDAAHAMPFDSAKAEYVPDSINSDSFCDVHPLAAEGA
jgi:hypothetical protein